MKWQLDEGYSVGSVNVRLSTVKTYCKLAAQAGTLDRSEYAMIRAIEGYRRKEGKHVDETRQETRRGTKKAQPVVLAQTQADRLKVEHGDDGQGRRDRLLTCLLLDHGYASGNWQG